MCAISTRLYVYYTMYMCTCIHHVQIKFDKTIDEICCQVKLTSFVYAFLTRQFTNKINMTTRCLIQSICQSDLYIQYNLSILNCSGTG